MVTGGYVHTYAFHTMGCKLNFYDSEVMSSGLEAEGFVRTDDPTQSDLVIINTCTVTNNSDAESRNLIRKYRRKNPRSFIVVTGCYAQAETDAISAMDEVDLVTTNVDKYDVMPIVRAFQGASMMTTESHDIMEKRPAEFRILEKFEAKTRAFIKIQDGCNLRCAYCIIPFVRGNNRSIHIADVIHQIEVLQQQGIEEVVLTGIHIGTWGRDFRPRLHLQNLLEAIEARGLDLWIRISSLDSPEIPDSMIDLMASSQTIVPHLHVPLQSGDNRTLRRMRRIYTREQYRDRVERLRERLPHMCLGADVIVGFPGETDDEFESTYAFLQDIPLDYLHVFPYSNRNGTAASKFEHQVNGRVIKNRARLLRDFSDERRHQHTKRHHGTERMGIVIPKSQNGYQRSVLTDNYIELGIDIQASFEGQRIPVWINAHEQFAVPQLDPVAGR